MTISKKCLGDIPKEMEDVVLAGLLLRMKRNCSEIFSTPTEIVSSIPIPMRRCTAGGEYLGKVSEEEIPSILQDPVKRGIVTQRGASSPMSPGGTNETYNISGSHYDVQMARLQPVIQKFGEYWKQPMEEREGNPVFPDINES